MSTPTTTTTTTTTPGVWQYLSEDIRPRRAKNYWKAFRRNSCITVTSTSCMFYNQLHLCWALLALTIANRVSKNYVPFTGQLQPIYFTCNGLKTKPIGFKYKLSKVWRIMLCNPMKALLNQGCLNQCSFRPPLVDSLWLTEHCYNQPRGDCYNLSRHTLHDKKLYTSNPVMIQIEFYFGTCS